MVRVRVWAAAAVLAASVAGLTFAEPAAPPDRPAPKDKAPAADKPAAKDKDKDKPATIPARVAAEAMLTEEQVNKALAALGPAVREHLARGEKVELPGLGVLRVVRVAEHRDLVDGRPAVIGGRNTVEFVPAGGLAEAANAPGAVPQEVVPPFEYNPLPAQTKSQHVPPQERAPSVRVR